MTLSGLLAGGQRHLCPKARVKKPQCPVLHWATPGIQVKHEGKIDKDQLRFLVSANVAAMAQSRQVREELVTETWI